MTPFLSLERQACALDDFQFETVLFIGKAAALLIDIIQKQQVVFLKGHDRVAVVTVWIALEIPEKFP